MGNFFVRRISLKNACVCKIPPSNLSESEAGLGLAPSRLRARGCPVDRHMVCLLRACLFEWFRPRQLRYKYFFNLPFLSAPYLFI